MKKDASGFYYFWSAAIVLSLALVIFALVFASLSGGGSEEAPETEAPTETPSDTVAETPEPVADAPTVLAETEDMGGDYIDKFIFLGDSTTYGLSYYGIVGETQVWTPKSGTLSLDHWSYTSVVYPDTGEELLIPAALELKQPEYMLITLGINGVSFMDEDYFISTYTQLVQTIQGLSPDTKIILNSIYPIAASYENQESINNTKIEAANAWVLAVAEATGTRYLDSASVLKDADGNLPESWQNGDGLHPTAEAYGYVIDYIRTHGYK